MFQNIQKLIKKAFLGQNGIGLINRKSHFSVHESIKNFAKSQFQQKDKRNLWYNLL